MNYILNALAVRRYPDVVPAEIAGQYKEAIRRMTVELATHLSRGSVLIKWGHIRVSVIAK